MPRHPPNAQKNKQQHTTKHLSQTYSKMLASTIQFTTNPPTPTPHHPHKAAEHRPGNQGALPQNPDSMPPPHTHTSTHQGHPPQQTTTTTTAAATHHKQACFLHHTTPQPTNPTHTAQGQPAAASVRDTPSRPAQTTHGPDNNKQPKKKEEANRPTKPILRKEVIQPHLPVRLPCYDFVPITSPTFDRSP